jgi:biotin synthase
VRDAGMKTCCGGIVGMGESRAQRAGLLQTLANLPAHPDSVPINRLVQVEGTPLNGTALLDPFEFVRTLAVARILMPKSMVRLSAGRESMSDELQALCFLAGANSIFYGEKLLTTGNPDTERDLALFARLGLRPMQVTETAGTVHADIVAAAPAHADDRVDSKAIDLHFVDSTNINPSNADSSSIDSSSIDSSSIDPSSIDPSSIAPDPVDRPDIVAA